MVNNFQGSQSTKILSEIPFKISQESLLKPTSEPTLEPTSTPKPTSTSWLYFCPLPRQLFYYCEQSNRLRADQITNQFQISSKTKTEFQAQLQEFFDKFQK